MSEPTPRCSRCGKERDRPGQRYCRACAAAYKRERNKMFSRAMHLLKKFGLNVTGEQIDGTNRTG